MFSRRPLARQLRCRPLGLPSILLVRFWLRLWWSLSGCDRHKNRPFPPRERLSASIRPTSCTHPMEHGRSGKKREEYETGWVERGGHLRGLDRRVLRALPGVAGQPPGRGGGRAAADRLGEDRGHDARSEERRVGKEGR